MKWPSNYFFAKYPVGYILLAGILISRGVAVHRHQAQTGDAQPKRFLQRDLIRAGAFFLSTIITVHLLKMLVGRARPQVELGPFAFLPFEGHSAANYDSFPSGHAASTLCLIMLFAWFCPRWWWTLLPIGVLALIGRVALSRHYATDLIASLVIACGAWMLVDYGLRRWFPIDASRSTATPADETPASETASRP